MKPVLVGRRGRQPRPADRRLRFGLPASAVLPLFGERPPGASPAPSVRAGVGGGPEPAALAVFDPALGTGGRLLARLGTSRTVTVAVHARPVTLKGLASVTLGGLAGMLLAQPFDAVTFLAPVYGLAAGAAAGGAAWVAVRGRGVTVVPVEAWRGRLEAIGRILGNADRLGQPFVSAPALRTMLHSALWHAANAVGEAGEGDVLRVFDEQLVSLEEATDAALAELESASIAARKAAVSDRLAAAVEELTHSLPVLGEPGTPTGDPAP